VPILLAAREMLRLSAGDRLEIIGDDPAIVEDMPVWCERAGHRLIDLTQREGKIISLVEKGAAPPRAARAAKPAGKPHPAAQRER
jgi:tRNA 2-thiouridine synthesizing protein A